MVIRGRVVIGQDGRDDWFTIEAEVPLIRCLVSAELRGNTQGKGEYTMEYCRYSPATPETQETVLQEHSGQAGRKGCGSERKKKKN